MLLGVARVLVPLLVLAGCAGGGAGQEGASPATSAPNAMSPGASAKAVQILGREPRIPERYRSRMDDALIAGRRFDLYQLRDELLASNPVALLDWEASRQLSGWLEASVFYIQDLDRIGAARSNDDLRFSSAITWLYVLASVLVDRERCTQSDGRVFVEYVIQGPARGTRAFAASLPPERLQQAIRAAINMEADIGPERSPRGHVCGYGVNYGADGRPADGRSLLVPPEQAGSRVAEARRALPNTLPQLVDRLLVIYKTRAQPRSD